MHKIHETLDAAWTCCRLTEEEDKEEVEAQLPCILIIYLFNYSFFFFFLLISYFEMEIKACLGKHTDVHAGLLQATAGVSIFLHILLYYIFQSTAYKRDRWCQNRS